MKTSLKWGSFEIVTHAQENQRVPNMINPRQNTPRHILNKLMKIEHEEQILKAAREKQQITHKGIPIRIRAGLSIETLQDRREWQDILKKAKAERIQHHQNSFTTDAKGIYIDRKHERKKPT